MPKLTPEERLAKAQKAVEAAKAREKKLAAQIKTKQRKEDARRKIIIGAVVMEHAERDAKFREALTYVLDRHTTREADRQLLGLSPKPNGKARPSHTPAKEFPAAAE